jgi:hypothetical protein
MMLSVIVTRRQHTDGLESVGMDIGDSGISSNYLSTLCEMPTYVCPSVWMSVIVAFQVIILIAKLSIAQNNNNNA